MRFALALSLVLAACGGAARPAQAPMPEPAAAPGEVAPTTDAPTGGARAPEVTPTESPAGAPSTMATPPPPPPPPPAGTRSPQKKEKGKTADPCAGGE